MSSLQDQLLKAGLVDKKKAKQANKQKAKQAKVQRKSSQAIVDETKEAVKAAQREKTEKDRELNAQRQAAANEKAIAAQIKQLVNLNKVSTQGDIAYNFKDGSVIKKLYVNATVQNQLSWGQLAIAKIDQKYEVIPAAVARKIAIRDETFIVAQAELDQQAQADEDPYADYQIPDDLMW